jgi:protein O-GlcNAc transferase
VAASLLQAAGLPELITHSLGEYEALALRLARDPEVLFAIREKLVRNRDASALFDTARFTRHLEAAFKTMVARHERRDMPESFAVERAA